MTTCLILRTMIAETLVGEVCMNRCIAVEGIQKMLLNSERKEMLLMYSSETCVCQDVGACTVIHHLVFPSVSKPGSPFAPRSWKPTFSIADASQCMVFLLSFIFSLSQTGFSKESKPS